MIFYATLFPIGGNTKEGEQENHKKPNRHKHY
ncbi:hypothetical protein HNQ88_001974 [Aureibacter tunicatorum]|uniref:Uncharacterized protein n=1 Tax=Aureibacter tunicatorum TaxID=866807 RepID=A0AAE3XL93_9BACT|nr:hypothetical protein [Aureibacter tunicatorum]BDD05137.1 hypothetical protein AUTU_26200 [Aureibacter tunicatorum]